MTHLRSLLASSAFVLAALAVLAPGLGHAQGMTESHESKVWLGGHLGLSPIGTLKAEILDQSMTFDASTAFEIGAQVEIRLTPLVSIGFAPAVLLHIKSPDDHDSASELDLPLRLAVGSDVAPKVRLYGFAAPGYTIEFLPDVGNNTVDAGHPHGFMIGFGGGIAYRVAPRVALTGELGYQFRFLSETVTGPVGSVDISQQNNYLTFGFGVMAGL